MDRGTLTVQWEKDSEGLAGKIDSTLLGRPARHWRGGYWGVWVGQCAPLLTQMVQVSLTLPLPQGKLELTSAPGREHLADV